jgi:hypothetical protein
VPVDPITDAAAFGLEDSTFDEDTEPSVDTKLVQEALRVAGKQ